MSRVYSNDCQVPTADDFIIPIHISPYLRQNTEGASHSYSSCSYNCDFIRSGRSPRSNLGHNSGSYIISSGDILRYVARRSAGSWPITHFSRTFSSGSSILFSWYSVPIKNYIKIFRFLRILRQ